MIIKYSPQGQPAQVFTWDPGTVRAAEAELLEVKFGGTWDEFNVQLLKGSMRSRRVMLWHLLKRDHPTLKFDDVDFAANEIELEFNADELQQFRAGIEKATGIEEAAREQALALIDQQIADVGDPEGKAPSESSVSATA